MWIVDTARFVIVGALGVAVWAGVQAGSSPVATINKTVVLWTPAAVGDAPQEQSPGEHRSQRRSDAL